MILMNENQQALLEAWLKSVGLWYYIEINKNGFDSIVFYRWDRKNHIQLNLGSIETREFKRQ